MDELLHTEFFIHRLYCIILAFFIEILMIVLGRGLGESGIRCQSTLLDANCLTRIMCKRLLCILIRDQTFSVHEAAGSSLVVSKPAASLKDCEVLTYPALSPASRALLRDP